MSKDQSQMFDELRNADFKELLGFAALIVAAFILLVLAFLFWGKIGY